MTAQEAIQRAHVAHGKIGCVCFRRILNVAPRPDGDYNVTIAHDWWCPLPRSQEGPQK